MSARQDPTHSAPPPPVVNEVRYSLPEMLAELQNEKAASSFAQEKLHQSEIGKLFQSRKKRRAKSS